MPGWACGRMRAALDVWAAFVVGAVCIFFFFLLVSVLERAAKGMAPWFAPDGLGHAGVAALGQPPLR